MILFVRVLITGGVFITFLRTKYHRFSFSANLKRELNVRCVLHDTLNQHIFHHYKVPTNICSGLILGKMWKELVLDRSHVFKPFTDKSLEGFNAKIKHNMSIKVWEMSPQLLNVLETFSYIQHGISIGKKEHLPTEPPKKSNSYFPFYWLVNRDPYNGIW